MPYHTSTVFAGMVKFSGRFVTVKGFIGGIAALAATWGVLFLLDRLVQLILERPLFSRPHTMGLLVLATTIVLFRLLIKRGDFQAGKGFFLSIFISTISYLLYHKYATGS